MHHLMVVLHIVIFCTWVYLVPSRVLPKEATLFNHVVYTPGLKIWILQGVAIIGLINVYIFGR